MLSVHTELANMGSHRNCYGNFDSTCNDIRWVTLN